MRSLRHGTVIGSPSIRQAKVLRWRRRAWPDFSGSPRDKIHIRSPFLGGGFGSKGLISGPQVLGIIAALVVGKPVKLVLRREQMFGPVGHRAPTRQTLRLGTNGEGKLRALDHRTRTTSSTFDDFFEPASDISHTLYASAAISTSHEAVQVDTGTPLFMRAPGEATGSIALESAIDEMAHACGMDPLAFRLRNYAEVEPISGKPFSSKALRDCYAQGAARFGWERRLRAPRSMRDHAGFLVGWGVGTATFPALMFEGHAKAVLRQDGSGVMEIGAHDMGQGAWTALAQIAADSLGTRYRPGRVQIRDLRPSRCRNRRRLGTHRDRRHGNSYSWCRGNRAACRSRDERRALTPVRRRKCRRTRARGSLVPPR